MATLKTLIAVTTIHITITPGKAGDKAKGVSPTPPVVKILPPKTRFQAADEAQQAELIASGGARLATDEETPKANEIVKIKTEGKSKAKDADKKSDDDGRDDGKKSDDDDDDAALRTLYEEVIGKAPAANMKAETMQARIDEAKAKASGRGDSDIV